MSFHLVQHTHKLGTQVQQCVDVIRVETFPRHPLVAARLVVQLPGHVAGSYMTSQWVEKMLGHITSESL